MKILLVAINARFIHTNPAVRSLRAYADKYAELTEIVEYTINQTEEEILRDLGTRKPDVLAFSCYIWNASMLRDLLPDIHKILPKASLWVGGPEVSWNAEETLQKFPCLTGVMTGEGEATFAELCEHYAEGKPVLKDICGLCLPGTGMTGQRMPLDLDSIPFFYQDMSEYKDRIPYYESSRGCPFRCAYCLSAIEKPVRFRSLDKVLPELDFFLHSLVPQVKFIDRTFNCDHQRCTTIWKYLKEHDNGITNFHFEIAADLLTDEEIDLLASLRPGLVQLEIGVQTTNQDTVREINRKMDLERLNTVVSRLRASGNMHIHLDLIAGLPEENLESFRKSFRDVFAMKPDNLQLGFLKVLKGSPLADRVSQYELQYREAAPYEVLSTRWLSYDDIMELKSVEEVLETYYNSHQFGFLISLLIRENEDPYQFFLDLAHFIEKQGYDRLQPSRMKKIELLLDFAVSCHPEKKEIYTEILTFDCYLRENCKRRPDFAKDPAQFRETLRLLFPRRDEHIEVFAYSVWEKEPKLLENPAYVRFDYEKRSPLDHNAEWVVLDMPGTET